MFKIKLKKLGRARRAVSVGLLNTIQRRVPASLLPYNTTLLDSERESTAKEIQNKSANTTWSQILEMDKSGRCAVIKSKRYRTLCVMLSSQRLKLLPVSFLVGTSRAVSNFRSCRKRAGRYPVLIQ